MIFHSYVSLPEGTNWCLGKWFWDLQEAGTQRSLAMFGHVGTFTSIAVTWKTMENWVKLFLCDGDLDWNISLKAMCFYSANSFAAMPLWTCVKPTWDMTWTFGSGGSDQRKIVDICNWTAGNILMIIIIIYCSNYLYILYILYTLHIFLNL